MKTIDIITLGCSKNLVDSEKLFARLEKAGYHVTHDSDEPQGEICVVNTCGFIGDAKEESINMILQMGQRKQEGTLKRLYVMGCLSERYLAELENELPEVDRFYGKFSWEELIADLEGKEIPVCSYERHLTTPSHYAYLKISEGCDRTCAYCAIPIITGRHKSRPIEEIEAEVRYLVQQGVKEFQVIAQELTYYGIDLYRHRAIAELIDRIASVPGVEWIRLHYAYPTDFPIELLEVMRKHKNVCRYLDIALQHISDPVLKRMHRHITGKQTRVLIATLRREVPGIELRTTLMVGFPGETDEDFEELMDFVRWARFDRMGAFSYSEEDGTTAARDYEDNVPADVKEARLSKLMRLQQRISAELQEAKVGQTMHVVIDRVEGPYYIARTEFDSPEVDPEVLIRDEGQQLAIGSFHDVVVDSSDDFDLYAHIVS
ncbi:MAG: 30S ribosomal protein S12 methylthiotransferase RimO [Bacteroidales bacterium]|nr:30S ribosomal protein S12 methylthiotransferase RimO [Candidatus Physcousia equi]